MAQSRLSVKQVFNQCDPKQFQFEVTSDLQSTRQSIGQDRALAAINFGIKIQRHGYNLFALGPTGAGKYTLIRDTLNNYIKKEHNIYDWCYAHNFKQNHTPIAFKLPAGMGRHLKEDLHELTETLAHIIPKAFQTDSYAKQLIAINNKYQAKEETKFSDLDRKSKNKRIAFIQSETDFTFAPLDEHDQALDAEAFDQLPKKQQEIFQDSIFSLQNDLQQLLQQLPKWQQESRLEVKRLNSRIAKQAIHLWISELKRNYKSQKAVIEHLNAIQSDVIENITLFLPQSETEKHADAPDAQSVLNNYHINLFVENEKNAKPPIVYEVNPTVESIFGRIDNTSPYSNPVSDFSQIKSGALHKANGGYLILDAYKLLDKSFSWEALKRALASGEIVIEHGYDSGSSHGSSMLSPQSIPLDIKIILLGDYHDYFTLGEIDPEFNALFKVIADFEDSVIRDEANMVKYAELMKAIIDRHQLMPFHQSAVARVIEQSSRWADDGERLSTHTGRLQDLMTEADYWAAENHQKVVTVENINQALNQKLVRTSRLRFHSQQAILRNNTLIESTGEQIGQINALTISELGEFTYGQPSRITALARLGDGKIIDIEHEANLSGNIHTKGLLILSHFFGHRYLKDKALSFNASIVFEQSYGGIDGDSASAAELAVLMSAIGQFPIRQSLAITGAIDQHGNMLPIGGVNEKIEGFFEICQARGLSGDQGVIVPEQNVHQLMLNHEIVSAVEQDNFHIYGASHIDDALELLSDLEIGHRDENDEFIEDSINALVETRLYEFASLSSDNDHDDEDNEEDEAKEVHTIAQDQ